MGIKNFLKNTIFINFTNIVIVLLGLLNRRILLNVLGITYIGYESLFKSIFGVLSFTEMGIATVISFKLYKAIAGNNTNEIEKNLSLFKSLYLIIGVVICAIGSGLSFYLPAILGNEEITNLSLLQTVFYFQLGETLCTYFLSYRRTLFIADQKEYICARIDLFFNILAQFIQIFILLIFRNYLLYLLCGFLRNILSNIWISYVSRKYYKYHISLSVGFQEIRNKEFWQEIKNFAVQKFALLAWSSSDNIIIAYFIGSAVLGVYSNYLLIISQVRNIVNGFYKAATASIGNYIYAEERDTKERERVFSMVNLGCFWGASFASISILTLIQPGIFILFGSQYLMDSVCVFLIAINLYIEWSYLGSYIYRSAFGNFAYDRIYMCIAAVTNIAISIAGVLYFDVAGVLFGTAISSMFIYWGRFKFVINEYLEVPAYPHMKQRVNFHAAFILELILACIMVRFIGLGWGGLFARLALSIVIVNGVNYVFFRNTLEFIKIKIIVSELLSSNVRLKNPGR